MSQPTRFGKNDWRSGTAVDSDGRPAYVADVNQAAFAATDYSISDMSGASQTVVAAGNGTHMIFLQAPATNSGVVWINVAGGTAVVGTGMPLAAGATVTLPGVSNAVTGIAASAHDKLAVYAG